MAVTSATEIANLALTKLGAASILDITATTGDPNTTLCAQVYGPALDEILRARPWTFATKRSSLARSTETPAFGWSYQFPLPVDCVQVLACNGYQPHQANSRKFKIQKRLVLCNEETAKVEYVYRNTDPVTYPADFVEALACLLAVKMCMAILGNIQVKGAFMAEYRAALAAAAIQNGTESRDHRRSYVNESDFVAARGYGDGLDFDNETS